MKVYRKNELELVDLSYGHTHLSSVCLGLLWHLTSQGRKIFCTFLIFSWTALKLVLLRVKRMWHLGKTDTIHHQPSSITNIHGKHVNLRKRGHFLPLNHSYSLPSELHCYPGACRTWRYCFSWASVGKRGVASAVHTSPFTQAVIQTELLKHTTLFYRSAANVVIFTQVLYNLGRDYTSTCFITQFVFTLTYLSTLFWRNNTLKSVKHFVTLVSVIQLKVTVSRLLLLE